MLRKDLYMGGCHTLEEVTKVAIDLVDNCNIYEKESGDIYSERKSTRSSEIPSSRQV